MSALLLSKLIAFLLFGSFAVWWIFSAYKSAKMTPQPERENDFAKQLSAGTENELQTWISRIADSGQSGFLNIRRWLVQQHQLETATATAITQLFLKNMEKNAPKVWFGAGGRSGKMGYESTDGSFTMYWELGGSDVVAIIDVPTEQAWVSATKIPLEKRQEVLEFIGKQTVERQISNGKGSFEIQSNCILIRTSI